MTDQHHPPMQSSVLPQHEFGLLVVAPPGSGKTNLICNLLLNHFKGYFHEVLICSPTVKNDPKWERVLNTKHIMVENKKLDKILGQGARKAKRKVPRIIHKSDGDPNDYAKEEAEDTKFDGKIPEGNIFDNLDEIPRRLKKQLDTAKQLEEMGYEPSDIKFLLNRVLLIEDDCAGLYRGTNKQDPLTNVAFKRRHYGCSMIKVSQQYTAMPAGHRVAMDSVIIFEIPNIKELDTIYENWQMGLNHDDWLEVYKYCTAEPFDFMFYNTKKPKKERIYRNFTEHVSITDEPPNSSLGTPTTQDACSTRLDPKDPSPPRSTQT